MPKEYREARAKLDKIKAWRKADVIPPQTFEEELDRQARVAHRRQLDLECLKVMEKYKRKTPKKERSGHV